MTRAEVIRRLVKYAPAVIGRHARPDVHNCCILASRIGFDALRLHGIEAEPAPVILDVANQAYIDWLEAGSPGGMDEFSRRRCWMISNDPAWQGATLPSQVTNAGRQWPGHLVLTIAGASPDEPATLIDLDLRGMRRKEYGIDPPAAVAVPWPALIAARSWSWGVVRYRRWLGATDDGWQAAGDWRRGPFEVPTIELHECIRRNALISEDKLWRQA